MYPELLFRRVTFMVSWFVGVNDQVVERFASFSNVFFKKIEQMEDPYRDPRLSDAAARALFAACLWQTFRLVHDRLYGCCLAESIERTCYTAPIGIPMSPDWQQQVARAETWRASPRGAR